MVISGNLPSKIMESGQDSAWGGSSLGRTGEIMTREPVEAKLSFLMPSYFFWLRSRRLRLIVILIDSQHIT